MGGGKMTDGQINAAIARECGWTEISSEEVRRRNAGQFYLQDGPWWRSEAERIVCTQKDLPDYCTDLNAMREAEETLKGKQFGTYGIALNDIEGSLWGIRATARQRAEAFLRTLGKWEEGK
jgi:hypothetical protein